MKSPRRFRAAGALALLVAGGCGGGGEEAATPRFLSLGAAPPGGAFFVVGGALAEVLGEAGMRVTAEATKGSGENIRRLASGELDLALSNAAVTYFAARGEDGWGREYPVQAVMTLAPNVATFVSPRRHEVNGIPDLAGKRVVVGVAGAGFEHFIRPIVEAHGVTYEDFIPLYNTQAGAVDMLTDDSAAAAFLGGAIPTASIVQATAGMDTRLVPLDPEVRRSLPERYPFYREAVIPAETYRGQAEDYLGLDVGSMHRFDAPRDPHRRRSRADLPGDPDALGAARLCGRKAPRGTLDQRAERRPRHRRLLPSRRRPLLPGSRDLVRARDRTLSLPPR